MEKVVSLCVMAVALAHVALSDPSTAATDKCENAGPQKVFIILDVYTSSESTINEAKAKLEQFVATFNLADTKVAIVTNKAGRNTKGSKIVSPIDDRNTLDELKADIATIRHSNGVLGRFKLSVVGALKTVEKMVDGCKPEKHVVVVFTSARDLFGVAEVVDCLMDAKTPAVYPTFKAANVFFVALEKQVPNDNGIRGLSTRRNRFRMRNVSKYSRIGFFVALRKQARNKRKCKQRRYLVRKFDQFSPTGLAQKVCASKDRSTGQICPPPPVTSLKACRINILSLYDKKKATRKDLSRSIRKSLDKSDIKVRKSSALDMSVADVNKRFEQMGKNHPGSKNVLLLVGAKKGSPHPDGVIVRKVTGKVRKWLHGLSDIAKLITLFKLDRALEGLQKEVCGSKDGGGAGVVPVP